MTTGYIYNVDTNHIVLIIIGDNNESVEKKADELNFLGVDEYGLSYVSYGLIETSDTERVTAN